MKVGPLLFLSTAGEVCGLSPFLPKASQQEARKKQGVVAVEVENGGDLQQRGTAEDEQIELPANAELTEQKQGAGYNVAGNAESIQSSATFLDLHHRPASKDQIVVEQPTLPLCTDKDVHVSFSKSGMTSRSLSWEVKFKYEPQTEKYADVSQEDIIAGVQPSFVSGCFSLDMETHKFSRRSPSAGVMVPAGEVHWKQAGEECKLYKSVGFSSGAYSAGMCLPVPAKDNSCSLLMCKAGARKSPADLKEINDALGGGGQVADEVPRKKRSSKGKSQPGEDGEGEGEGQDVPPEVQRGVDPNNPNEEGCSGCVGCCKPGEPSGR